MTYREPFYPIKMAARDFLGVVNSLSDEQFLTTLYEWTPRDIVAHLIGWNTLMIEASLSILDGRQPAYYDDTPFNYSHINAGYSAKYPSQNKEDLLAQLQSSLEELEKFIQGLSDEEINADRGVLHHSGVPATVKKIIASLASDYEYHTQQIRDWIGKG
ncbi:MAG: ClbS/DfsB family four-helix bundle protein [Anaerolineales bacterium]|nr:ClbS/DfsB family four-helix bundle protein [Anaerolineales bacterium]